MRLKDKIVSFNEPEWLFPYQYMKVGDSFFMPTMRPAYAHYIIDKTSKKNGVVMKTYTVKEDDVLGVRSWRVR
jgi:hypothetical protein